MKATIFLIFLAFFTVYAEVVRYDLNVRSIPAAPDGYPRRVLTVYEGETWNPTAPFPGATIRAKLGDELRITVNNELEDQSISIHFHGIHMVNNPWMDGVHGITQCPIQPQSSFTYIFNVTQTGTYWYHSHAGAQYGDGLFGPIILSYPSLAEDPIYAQYQYGTDFTLTLQDWFHEAWEDLLAAYVGPYAAFPGYIPKYPWPPTSLLINGQGGGNCSLIECDPWDTTMCAENRQCVPLRAPLFGTCNETLHAPQRFTCHGNTTRIRLINAANAIPLEFWIDRHNLTIVSRDGVEIMPFETDYLTIHVGQRLDVIVRCDQDPTYQYKMFVSVPNAFIPGEEEHKPDIMSTAFLTYPNSPNMTIEPISSYLLTNDSVYFEYQLKPKNKEQALGAVKRIILNYGVMYNRTDGDKLEEWTINGNTFAMPTAPLLQTSFLDGKYSSVLVNKTGNVGNIEKTYIEALEYGFVYEIVIASSDSQQHPWHLHGYTVNFTAAGVMNDTDLPYHYGECGYKITHYEHFDFNSVLKPYSKATDVLSIGDSFTVPAKGYVAFRFKADNPGPWMLHCHMEWHLATGLAMVFSVEKDGSYRNLIAPPPPEFPVCGPKSQWPPITTPSSPPTRATSTASFIVGNLFWLAVVLVFLRA